MREFLIRHKVLLIVLAVVFSALYLLAAILIVTFFFRMCSSAFGFGALWRTDIPANATGWDNISVASSIRLSLSLPCL